MDHLCSSSHPFSPSRRVDYCLNWPQPLPSPSFHFSSADIYWSLSEKFPSSHPFPKVELQRKSLRLVCACMCAWFINEPEQAFIFLFRFFFFFYPRGNFVLSCLFFDSQPVCPFYLFLSNSVLFPSIFLPYLDPCTIPTCYLSSSLKPLLSLPLSFSIPGRLYSLLNQYSSLVCRNCRTTRPDVSLYSFIYENVSSPATADACDSTRDSGMSPVTSDSH